MNETVAEKAKKIDAMIEGFLPKEEGFASTVMSAMNYSIHVGGKRLRPMFMTETYAMFGGTDDIVYPFAAAIEMIHTYSLCHDDLPAMDNDDMRRGMPSTHAKFGEAMGILAGDALLNYAFETSLKAFDMIPDDLSDADKVEMSRRISKALSILAKKAGIYGMIAGQVVDIESEGKSSSEISMDTIKFIHENKTAAMIESSMMIGAVLAGASDKDLSVIESVGSDVGLAFQIRDDILDIESSNEVLGKPVGSDEKNDKATYVTLAGLAQAKEDVRMISERAVGNLKSLHASANESGKFLIALIEYLINRDK